MSNVRAVVLDEKKSVETGYQKEELMSIVEDVENKSIFSDANSVSLTKVVGIVNDTYYSNGEGLVIECDIVDEDTLGLIRKGHVNIAPQLVVEKFTSQFIKGIEGLFTTTSPNYIVGQTTVIDDA